jgi:hypothetical protein
MTDKTITEQARALAERLREQAAEIALEGHAGWGNTMADAADMLERLAAPPAEAPAVEQKQWLWRVFNQGHPDGHEESTNEWGRWNLISFKDAERLAGDDATRRYEFVPYMPASPLAEAPAEQWKEVGTAAFGFGTAIEKEAPAAVEPVAVHEFPDGKREYVFSYSQLTAARQEGYQAGLKAAVQEDKEIKDAPLGLSNDEASAWISGWSACREAVIAAAPKGGKQP